MNNSRIRIMGVALAVCFIFLSGCDVATTSTEGSLTGYWTSAYGDGFELSSNSREGFRYTQYDDADRNVSFAGTVTNNPDYYAESDYLIILITNSGSWAKTEDTYYAVHWKNLADSLVAAASAYKVGGEYNNGMKTYEEALAEYTVENGYYGYYGEYQKQ